MNANLWIAVCCVIAVALFAGAVVYATRDKGQRGAGGAWRLPRLSRLRRPRPVTWARAAIRGRLARIPPAENPDPAPPVTQAHMTALQRLDGARPWIDDTGTFTRIIAEGDE